MYDTPFHEKPLADLTFLVTGGAGFIGSNIVEYLLKYGAKKVRTFDNYSNGFHKNLQLFAAHPNLEILDGDIRGRGGPARQPARALISCCIRPRLARCRAPLKTRF